MPNATRMAPNRIINEVQRFRDLFSPITFNKTFMLTIFAFVRLHSHWTTTTQILPFEHLQQTIIAGCEKCTNNGRSQYSTNLTILLYAMYSVLVISLRTSLISTFNNNTFTVYCFIYFDNNQEINSIIVIDVEHK